MLFGCAAIAAVVATTAVFTRGAAPAGGAALPVQPAACAMLTDLALPQTTIRLAELVPAGAFHAPRRGAAGGGSRVLPRGRDQRSRRQLRGVAARGHLERQVPHRRQRGHGGGDQLWRHGRRPQPRLRHREHRHRPRPIGRRIRCELGPRPPRSHRRLRAPIAAPHRGPREGNHRGVLRRGARVRLLRRLLEGRPAGHDGGATVSRGLRRPRRRRSRPRLDPLPPRRPSLVRAGDARRPRQLDPAGQGGAARQRGHRRVRRESTASRTA